MSNSGDAARKNRKRRIVEDESDASEDCLDGFIEELMQLSNRRRNRLQHASKNTQEQSRSGRRALLEDDARRHGERNEGSDSPSRNPTDEQLMPEINTHTNPDRYLSPSFPERTSSATQERRRNSVVLSHVLASRNEQIPTAEAEEELVDNEHVEESPRDDDVNSPLDDNNLLANTLEPLQEVHSRQRNQLMNNNQRSGRLSESSRRAGRGNARNQLTGISVSQIGASVDDDDSTSALNSGPENPRQLWKKAIESRLSEDPNFFKSEEAMLQLSTRVKKGVCSYKGIQVTPKNCADVNTVYEDSYMVQDLFVDRSAVSRRASGERGYTESFKQLLSVVGQFIRWAIVRKEICVFDGWKTNALFNAVSKEMLIQTFVEYFRVGGAAGTVNVKTIHLRTVVRSALNRCENNPQKRDGLRMVYFYLQKSGNACKRVGRNKKTMKRVAFGRAEEGSLLMLEDFGTCLKEARSSLDGIMHTFEASAENGSVGRRAVFFSDALVKKWCVNFLALIIFLSGGQRPQVFEQVQCPCDEDMDLWASAPYEPRYISLETINEKRSRTTDLPSLTIPKFSLKYISFHVKTIRPFILTQSGITETNEDCPLLIHSETGHRLDRNQVLSSLRSFACRIDPELKNITTMSLRASYATMMFRAHRAGEVFQHLNEDAFLRELGKIMNTSVEQLKQTYISSDSSDFHETAQEVACFLDGVVDEVENVAFQDVTYDVTRYRREKEVRDVFG